MLRYCGVVDHLDKSTVHKGEQLFEVDRSWQKSEEAVLMKASDPGLVIVSTTGFEESAF